MFQVFGKLNWSLANTKQLSRMEVLIVDYWGNRWYAISILKKILNQNMPINMSNTAKD